MRTRVVEEFECDECLGDKATGSGYEGLTLAYAISVLEGEVITLCDYVVTPFTTLGPKNDPKETRAYREMLRSRGKTILKIEKRPCATS